MGAPMEVRTTGRLRHSGLRIAPMQDDMVLLKVVVGSRQGWGVMSLQDFLQKLDLEVLRTDEILIGTILPRASRRLSS